MDIKQAIAISILIISVTLITLIVADTIRVLRS